MSVRALLLAASVLAAPVHAQVSLTHVHGLAYSPDGKRLMVPSHHGLAVYEKGRWSKAPGPAHDYMGFAATGKGLYSSGHPAPGSGLVNPFGLMRSRDGGRTWQKLAFEGESDFHLLATSWNGNAVYVWNEEPNSRMRRPGLHLTRDEGSTWKPARSAGLDGKPRALAVHPHDPSLIAIATSQGVFLSHDSGERFNAISVAQGTAVCFDLDGKHLWYGSFAGRPQLARTALAAGPPQELKLPPLMDDAVAYIAQNPAMPGHYAIATFQRSVYLSINAGTSWQPIAQHGETH